MIREIRKLKFGEEFYFVFLISNFQFQVNGNAEIAF